MIDTINQRHSPPFTMRILSDIEKEIVDEYINEVASRNISTDYKLLICPFGATGVGKTTVVKPLAEALHLPRVSGDELRKKLTARGLTYEPLYDIWNTVSLYFLSKGYGLVIDSNSAGRVEAIEDIVSHYLLKKIYIRVTAGEEYVVHKLLYYTGEKFMGNTQQDLVNDYFRTRETTETICKEKRLVFDYEIDTSLPDRDIRIDAILRDIKKTAGRETPLAKVAG